MENKKVETFEIEKDLELSIIQSAYEPLEVFFKSKKLIKDLEEKDFKILAISAANFSNLIGTEVEKRKLIESKTVLKKNVEQLELFKKNPK